MPSATDLLAYLKLQLEQFPEPHRYLVGFSGGLDSSVLLHALFQLKLEVPIIAIHIDHSIHPQSHEWQRHCAEFAKQLSVDFRPLVINGKAPVGESPEAWAREKRYQAFRRFMEPDDLLLLGQHRDDQIETFLLRLLRGAGPHGLSAMKRLTFFSGGWIGRPFLELERHYLKDYAKRYALHWIEDPSNHELRYDRNYLRQKVIPVIRERWPSFTVNINRSISLLADTTVLLDEIAAQDLARVTDQGSTSISIKTLSGLCEIRLRNLLHYWIRKEGFPVPTECKLRQIIDTVIRAKEDRSPCVEWQGVEVRRYRDQLMILNPLGEHDSSLSYCWNLEHPMKISTGTLRARKIKGAGFRIDGNTVEVRFRQGGETFRQAGKRHTTTLKKYLQEKGIPPWLRDRIPLIYLDGELVAIADLCIADKFSVDTNTMGWMIEFIPD